MGPKGKMASSLYNDFVQCDIINESKIKIQRLRYAQYTATTVVRLKSIPKY